MSENDYDLEHDMDLERLREAVKGRLQRRNPRKMIIIAIGASLLLSSVFSGGSRITGFGRFDWWPLLLIFMVIMFSGVLRRGVRWLSGGGRSSVPSDRELDRAI